VKIDPNDVEVLYLIGKNYNILKNTDKALEYLENAIKINPSYKKANELLEKLKK